MDTYDKIIYIMKIHAICKNVFCKQMLTALGG